MPLRIYLNFLYVCKPVWVYVLLSVSDVGGHTELASLILENKQLLAAFVGAVN